MRISRRWRAAIPCLLAVSCFWFLYARSDLVRFDPLNDLATNTNFDDVSFELPMVQYFHTRWMRGELPLWNPYQAAGNPVIGTLQQRLLYPPRVMLFTAFGLEYGQFLEIGLHFFLTVFGTYAMLRSFRLQQPAAFLGALSVLLASEFHYKTFSHNVFATLAWVPVCVWSIRLFLFRPTLARAAILGLAFSMLIYAGYPQFAYYAIHLCIAIFLAGCVSFRRRLSRNRIRFLCLLLVALVICVAVTLPQMVAASEFFSLGIRGAVGVSFEQFGKYGGHPVTSLVPHLYAGKATVPYLHILTALVLSGFILGWKQFPRLRLHILAMVLVAIPTVLMSMGTGASPFPKWVFEYYPLGTAFRHPVRALYLLLFPSAFALALLAQCVATLRPVRNPRISLVPYAFFTLAISLILLPGKTFHSHAFLHSARYMNEFARDLQKVIPAGEQNRFAAITGFQTEPYRRAGLLSERQSFSEYEPSNGYRFYLYAKLISEGLRKQSKDEVWLGDLNLTYDALSDPNALQFLRASSVNFVLGDSMFWKNLPPEKRQKISANPTLRHIGAIPNSRVKSMFQQQLDPMKMQILTGYFQNYTSLFEVFRISGSLPRAYTTNQIALAENPEGAATRMQQSLNPLQETLIEAPPGAQESSILDQSRIFSDDSFQAASFVIDEPERIVIRVKTKGDAFLVLNDSFFPGWECKVNGVPRNIFAANIMFRGVRLTSGDHEIEFSYKPRTLLATLWISLLGYAGAILILVTALWRNTRNQLSCTSGGSL